MEWEATQEEVKKVMNVGRNTIKKELIEMITEELVKRIVREVRKTSIVLF